MELGINTFGLSRRLGRNTAGTLAALGECGITAIEPCIVFSKAFAPPLRALLRTGFAFAGLAGGNFFGGRAAAFVREASARGFSVKGAHCALCDLGSDTLRRMIKPALAFARKYGLEYYAVSLNADSPERAEKYLPALGAFVEAMNAAGVDVLYHNHDGELRGTGAPLDRLLGEVPGLGLQLDAGWALFAGRDPASLLGEYSGRIKSIHLKDIRPGCKDRKKRFAAVGEGGIPLRELVRAAGSHGWSLVIDQDASDGDIMRDIAAGADNVMRCL